MSDQPVVKKRRTKAEIVAEKAACAAMTAEKKPRKKRQPKAVVAAWPFPTSEADKAALEAYDPLVAAALHVKLSEQEVEVAEEKAAPEVTLPYVSYSDEERARLAALPYVLHPKSTPDDFGFVVEVPANPTPVTFWQKIKKALRF